MKQLIPIAICLAIIVFSGSVAAVLILTWDKAPWWRTSPTPRRAIIDDRDRVRAWKIRKRYPDAFIAPEPVRQSDAGKLEIREGS